MSRNEQRTFQHEINKNKDWYRKLPDSKKRFIGWHIEQKVIENDNITAGILDDCFKAAMIQISNISLPDCKEIIRAANKHIEEVKSVLELDLKGDYLKMIKDERLKAEIKGKALEMIKNGQVPSKGTVELKKLYKDWVYKDLQIIWAEAKEEYNYQKEKIINEIGIDVNNKLTKLKIIETIQKIQGEFCTYEKSIEGVKAADRLYKDKTIVKEERTALKVQMRASKEELEKQMNELKAKLEDLNKIEKNKLDELEEIEAVFNI